MGSTWLSFYRAFQDKIILLVSTNNYLSAAPEIFANRLYGVRNEKYKNFTLGVLRIQRDSQQILEILCNLTAGLASLPQFILWPQSTWSEREHQRLELGDWIWVKTRFKWSFVLFIFFPHKCKWALYKSHGKCTILEFTENVYLKYLNNPVCRVGLPLQNKQPPIW